jgi:nicotinate-nucleotide adenylyltransferase
MKKIGIMGGTFNPIHNGHIALAKAAFEYCKLDEVWFMPSGCSYMKSKDSIVAGEDRLEMTRLAIEGFSCFKCSDLEVKRLGNTYTAETLEILNEMYPEYKFYFIMGADSLFGLPRWKQPEKIAALCTLATVVRDDVNLQELEMQKQYLEKSFHASIVLLPFNKIDISSSMVREKLEKGGDVDGIIPDKVMSYIEAKHLYKKENVNG